MKFKGMSVTRNWPRLNQFRRLPSLVAVFSVLVAACASTAEPAPAGRTLVFAVSDSPRSLDPAGLVGNQSENTIDMLLYDRLTHMDLNGKLHSELAESWTETKNSVTFKLKRGPTCDDGTPITPSVVAASLIRYGDPGNKSIFKALTLGPAGVDVTTDAAANTVTLTAKSPYNDLLAGSAAPWESIVCPSGNSNPASLTTKSSGSGPYTLLKSEPGRYTFAVRPDYSWGPDGMTTKRAGYPQQLVMLTDASNETTVANQLLQGEIDIAFFKGATRKQFENNSSYSSDIQGAFGSDYLMIKQDGIFQDQGLRQALDMAIDPKQLNQAMLFGYGIISTSVSTSPQGANSACYEPATANLQVWYDPSASKKLLDSLGWIAGSNGVRSKGGKQLTVKVVGDSARHAAGPEYIFESLKAIGVDAQLRSLDHNSWISAVRDKPDFDVSIMPQPGSVPSPAQGFPYISGPNTPAGGNFVHAQNPVTAQLIAKAQDQTGSAACDTWKAAQRSAVGSYDIKPLFAETRAWIAKKGVVVKGAAASSTAFDPFSLKS